jgi:signal transduction histidine kinase
MPVLSPQQPADPLPGRAAKQLPWRDRIVQFFATVALAWRNQRPSVRKSMLGWLGMMWLVTLIFSVLVAAYNTHTAERYLWQSRLREELSNSSHTLMDFVGRGQMIMRLLGAVDDQALAAQPGLFEQALLSDPSLLELVKIDGQGDIKIAVVRDRRILGDMFTLSQAQWFRQAQAGEDYYSDVQYSFQDTPYLILAVKAHDGGVIAARLRMDVLQEVVGNLDIGESGQVYVADENGNVMAHTRHELINTNVRTIPVFDQLLQQQDRTWEGEYTSLAGDKVLGATTRVAATDWMLGVEVLQDEAYESSRIAVYATMITISLLAIIVMLGNARFLRDLIFRPIEQLRAGTERLGEGYYDFRLRFRRYDEIGVVTDAFNSLAAALQKRDADLKAKNQALSVEIAEHERTQEALEQLNATLELRIAERTERLEAMTHELQRSNKSLEEFAYVASHDLQEPLRKVRTFGDRLQARYGHVLDDTGNDYLTRMQNGSTRMQALIDALLTYSRVTTKAQPLVPVNLNDVVTDVLSDLDVAIETLHATVTVGPLPSVAADSTQMRQLFQNLLGNALKFHKPDRAPHVSITSSRCDNAGCYEIVVADDGIGFDIQYAERIFQVFQRLHGRSEYEGTGVGLAICRKIVERHGGSIRAESTPGSGARFIISLPLQPGTGEATGPGQEEAEEAPAFG